MAVVLQQTQRRGSVMYRRTENALVLIVRADGTAVEPRKRWRRVVRGIGPLFVSCCLIAYYGHSLPGEGPTLRIALDRVPEERVVEFGHADRLPALPSAVPQTSGQNATPMEPRRLAALESHVKPTQIAPAPVLTRTVRPGSNGVLPISYSLAEKVSSESGGIEVAKTLASDAGAATDLTIFLIGGSLIEVDRSELVAALAELGAGDKADRLPPAETSGRLSLDRVRTAGLDLRYDAIGDKLILKP